MAGVLLVIRAAQPARLDAQHAVVVTDVGDVEPAKLEPARPREDERLGAHGSSRANAPRAVRMASCALGQACVQREVGDGRLDLVG